MSAYIHKDDRFEQTAPPVRECPHCGAHAQMLPVSTPKFKTLTETAPSHVALGFQCSACGEPRFGKALVRSISADRVELSGGVVEIERPKERFAFTYLPAEVRELFSEALECYSSDLHNAFASMCRRTVAASVAHLPEPGQSRWQNAFAEVIEIGEIDDATAATFKRVLFNSSASMPKIDAGQSAVLLEIMKDVLYQCHVRAAKFRAAMKMRRLFADEQPSKVTSLRRARGATSA